MTREQYDELSAPLVRTLLDMEDDILREIAAQLAKDGRVSDTSKWRIRQLARSGRFDKRAAAIIDGYSGVQNGQALDMILEAAQTEIGYLDNAVQAANTAGLAEYFSDIPAETSALNAAKAFQRQAASDLNLVNTVMKYKAGSAFVSAVNSVYRESQKSRQDVLDVMGKSSAKVVMGHMSLQEATRKTIRELARKGIPAFVDKAGREWSPEAYIMMDMRSTLANTARAAQDMRCDQYGIQLIEVSSHMGARPLCAPYQGRIFSRDGSKGITTDGAGGKIYYTPLSETSFGEPAGLFGINCGHVQYPFAPGINFQRYFPYPKEENDERYKQFQRQRAMEWDIRATKRECMMLQETGDTEGLQKASQRLRAQKQKYSQYSKDCGLGTHYDRTQVYGYDRSKSSKTVWAERKAKSGLDNVAKSGIIKSEGVARLEQAKSRDHKIMINDVSISKATAPLIPGFSNEQNKRLAELHKELLTKSMLENDSNETAFLFNPFDLTYVFQHGVENSVNILENPEAFSMITSGRFSNLFLLHNHPSTKSFSYSDIGVFLLNDSIGGITVITNTGETHCLIKTNKYNFEEAYNVLSDIRREFNASTPNSEEDAEIVKRFIKSSKKTGIVSL